jgi:hypothetical protein
MIASGCWGGIQASCLSPTPRRMEPWSERDGGMVALLDGDKQSAFVQLRDVGPTDLNSYPNHALLLTGSKSAYRPPGGTR